MRTYVGRAGHSTYMEYLRAKEQQALTRKDRLRRAVPLAALQALPVALALTLMLRLGIHAPLGIAIVAFLLIELGWPGVTIMRAYEPVPDIESLRELAEAERITARTIVRLRRRGYVVLHDRMVSDSESTIGHLVIGPGGVFVLTSDPSKGVVRYDKEGVTCDGAPLRQVIGRTAWLAGEVRTQLRSAMPMVKIPVTAVLVMVEATVLWKDGAVDGVTIIDLKRTPGFIRARPMRLSPTDVARVREAADRLFPPFTSNRIGDGVTVDRDQWVALMDALRTIRESDGDARDMLDRLAEIEYDLAKQGDPASRSGLALSRSGEPLTVARPGSVEPRGGALLTAVRPLEDDLLDPVEDALDA